MKLKKRKIAEWIHRIAGLIIFDSFISLLALAVLLYSIEKLAELGVSGWEANLNLVLSALAFSYLRITNFLYWLFDINMFDFKFWRNIK